MYIYIEMRKIFQKFSALLLAMLVLVATSSFTVSMHFCGEKLIDYSFTETLKNCNDSSFKTSFETLFSKKSCCSDKHIVKQSQNELSQKEITTSIYKKIDFINHFYDYEEIFVLQNLQDESSTIYYSPPNLIWDRVILFETFLI